MPVYAVGPGRIAKISSFTGLGQLVAIEHTGSFTIPERSETVNSLSYYYPTETVSKFYSIYLHINATQGLTVGQCVNRGLQIGTVANISAPHLHFEVRHPNQQPSGDWSLVGDSTNWAKFSEGGYNGYYINPQPMVDAGLRHAGQFLAANATSAPTPPQTLRVVE